MYELTVQAEFSAAHALRGYPGKCARLHGHNFKIEVVVCGTELDDLGMLVDFRKVKARLQEVTEAFDHRNLNEVPPFDERNPTAENLARYLYEQLSDGLPAGTRVAATTVHETCRAAATYRAA